jgi:hypothetical protein
MIQKLKKISDNDMKLIKEDLTLFKLIFQNKSKFDTVFSDLYFRWSTISEKDSKLKSVLFNKDMLNSKADAEYLKRVEAYVFEDEFKNETQNLQTSEKNTGKIQSKSNSP